MSSPLRILPPTAPLMGRPILSLPFDSRSCRRAALVSWTAIDAVLAVDDHGLELAALLNEKLGLWQFIAAVRTTRDKLFRQLQNRTGSIVRAFMPR
jgi:hypothetical protein